MFDIVFKAVDYYYSRAYMDPFLLEESDTRSGIHLPTIRPTYARGGAFHIHSPLAYVYGLSRSSPIQHSFLRSLGHLMTWRGVFFILARIYSIMDQHTFKGEHSVSIYPLYAYVSFFVVPFILFSFLFGCSAFYSFVVDKFIFIFILSLRSLYWTFSLPFHIHILHSFTLLDSCPFICIT